MWSAGDLAELINLEVQNTADTKDTSFHTHIKKLRMMYLQHETNDGPNTWVFSGFLDNKSHAIKLLWYYS